MQQEVMQHEDAASLTVVVELPVCCQLVRKLGLFRVLRAKGKTLSSGGFGVSILLEDDDADDTTSSQKVSPFEDGKDILKAPATASEAPKTPTLATDLATVKDKPTESSESTSDAAEPQKRQISSSEYLFVEEVVFLFERGLLECLDDDNDDSSSASRLTSSQLYQLMPEMGMSLAMYFVFAHLRSQDFRVLRYAADRLPLLRRQQEGKDSMTKAEFTELKRAVRQSVQDAMVPSIPENDNGLTLCWDAYKPNTQFAKTNPGIPDFYVTVTYYGSPQASFSAIHNLLWKECDGVPLKLALVSDSGVVIMFGVSPDGVPVLANKQEEG